VTRVRRNWGATGRVAPGISARGSHRTVRNNLSLHGSCRSGHQTVETVLTQMHAKPNSPAPRHLGNLANPLCGTAVHSLRLLRALSQINRESHRRRSRLFSQDGTHAVADSGSLSATARDPSWITMRGPTTVVRRPKILGRGVHATSGSSSLVLHPAKLVPVRLIRRLVDHEFQR
jgi:hypothetical protein